MELPMAENLPSSKFRILVVDDHPVVREGLVRMIDREPDLITCGEASVAEETMRAIAASKPSLILLDLSLKCKPGLELIKSIHAEYPTIKILVLSMHDENVWAERVLRAGANGFVMKEEPSKVLMTKIRHALSGGICLSDQMFERLAGKLTGKATSAGDSNVDALGDRELEILHLISKGMSTREIAATLHLSGKTVETHRENLKRKLNLPNGTALLRFAVLRFLDEG
jgi:DNA-binding NarL/FixJ family response regulator